MITKFR